MKDRKEEIALILEFLMGLYESYSDLDFQENEITPDSNIALFQLDSVDHIKIILQIEEKYGFEFSNEELTLDKIKNIRDMANFIVQHSGGEH